MTFTFPGALLGSFVRICNFFLSDVTSGWAPGKDKEALAPMELTRTAPVHVLQFAVISVSSTVLITHGAEEAEYVFDEMSVFLSSLVAKPEKY